jgi:MYXO-CTERM domain-containing protein
MKPYVISGLLLLTAGSLAHAATYSFGTSAEYDANFREVLNGGAIAHNPSGYLSNTGVNQTVVVAYDTDGSAGAGTTLYPITLGTTLSVSADVRFTHTGSFGFYFSAVGGGSTYLALLNPTATNDQFRIFSGGSMATGTAGTSTDFSNATTNPVNLNEFTNISATFQVLSSNSIRISMTAGAQSFSWDYTGVTLPSEVEIAFRSFNPAGAVDPSLDIDNFTVTDPIPEPSVTWLGGLGVLGLLARRRR